MNILDLVSQYLGKYGGQVYGQPKMGMPKREMPGNMANPIPDQRFFNIGGARQGGMPGWQDMLSGMPGQGSSMPKQNMGAMPSWMDILKGVKMPSGQMRKMPMLPNKIKRATPQVPYQYKPIPKGGPSSYGVGWGG